MQGMELHHQLEREQLWDLIKSLRKELAFERLQAAAVVSHGLLIPPPLPLFFFFSSFPPCVCVCFPSSPECCQL